MSEPLTADRRATMVWTAPGWLPLAGSSLILLGCMVLFGWMSRQPLLIGLLPGLPPMVVNTALMFVASGLALIAASHARHGIVRGLGGAIGLLASLILVEHVTGIDLGIDATDAHSWVQDGFPNPGRSSPVTAFCFSLIALTLVLIASTNPRHLKLASWLALGAALVSGSGGLGHILRLDVLYSSYTLRGMAVPTALGLFALGISLHRAISFRLAPSNELGEDRRIVSVGSLLLVTVALAAGLPVFFVVKSHIEDTIGAGMRTSLTTEVQLLDTVLTLRSQRAAIVSNRPNAIATLRAIHADPEDVAARGLLQATVESFRPHGFSAMRVTLPGGRVLASSGTFALDPRLVLPLESYPDHQLIWHGEYYLRSRFGILDGSQLLATVDMEQPLTQMAVAVDSARALGESGELQVCKRLDARVLCLPSRRNPEPLDLPHTPGSRARLLDLAAAGGSGMATGRDELGHQVVGVYAPVSPHGLFAILKMDTAELYRPLRRDLEKSLAIAALGVLLGSILFRTMVKPIARKLLLAREISQDKTRAMERLHSFQRAVFEQAPDGILVADDSGLILEANERLAALFGYAPEILAGMRIEDLVPGHLRAAHRIRRAEFARSPTTRVMSADRTLRGQRADGSEFPIEVALAPMTTPDGARVIAIVKDVSEARRAETLIRDALKEKELLLGEIHHRVKNNLQIVHSLLDMQAGLTQDPSAAGALRDSQNRIQSMALIHQTLYQSRDFAEVEFGQFLETLMGHLQGSYGRNDLRLDSRADSVRLPIDRAIPCGLIVNELVTNALKHAFPGQRRGTVTVELHRLPGNRVEVAVSDDGIGIPDSVDLSTLSSLGMQLVQVLTDQLKAELHVQRRGPTRVAVVFPLH